MKVLHIGNIANVAFNNVKALRSLGFEADLLLKKNSSGSSNPENEDQGILSNPPEWLKVWPGSPASSLKLPLLARNYDLIQAYAGVPAYAQFFGKPLLPFCTGSDLRLTVFSGSIQGRLLARAYKKAKRVLYSNCDHYLYAQKLGLKNASYFPLMVDSEKYL